MTPRARDPAIVTPPRAVRQLLEAPRQYQPEQIYLFGSFARGEADALSDIDVAIIKRTTPPFLDRFREVAGRLPPDFGAVDVSQ